MDKPEIIPEESNPEIIGDEIDETTEKMQRFFKAVDSELKTEENTGTPDQIAISNAIRKVFRDEDKKFAYTGKTSMFSLINFIEKKLAEKR